MLLSLVGRFTTRGTTSNFLRSASPKSYLGTAIVTGSNYPEATVRMYKYMHAHACMCIALLHLLLLFDQLHGVVSTYMLWCIHTTCCGVYYMLWHIHAVAYTCCGVYMLWRILHAVAYTCCGVCMLWCIHAVAYTTCCGVYILWCIRAVQMEAYITQVEYG